MLIVTMLYGDSVCFNFIYRETSPREMSRLTNRAAVQMLTKCTANKSRIKIIEACSKTGYVLTQ